jgi:hypothetical protein
MAPATSRRPREGLAQSRVVTGVIAGLLMLVACSTYYVTHRQDGYLDNLARAPNFSPRDTSRESDAAATHSAAETHTKVPPKNSLLRRPFAVTSTHTRA